MQNASNTDDFVCEAKVTENGVTTKIVHPLKPSVLQLNCRCSKVPSARKPLSFTKT